MLDDPTNLFVLELASPASDAAGVTASTQTLCCLFLGSCLLALSQDDNSTSSLAPDKFLQAIDSKIGLTRFLDLLKRPMQLGSLAGGRVSATSLRDELFVTVSFRGFYEDKVEAIRKYIFEHYSGISGGNSIGVKASDNAVVEMQRTRIEELEAQLEALNSATGAHPINGSGDVDVVSIFNTVAELEAEKLAALKNVEILSSQVSSLYEEKQAAQTQLIQAQRLLEQSEFEKQALEQTCNELSSLEVENAELLLRSEAAENRLAASKQMSPGDFSDGSNNFTDEILLLKESVLRLEDEKSRLREVLDTRDRKIALLEDELRSPMPGEANRDRKITELENRNAELKQQMWGREAELSDLRNDLGSQIESYEEKLAMYKSLLASTEEQLEEDKFLIGTLKEQVEAQKVAPVQTYDHSTNLETEIDKPQTETLMAQVEELTTRIDVLTTDIVTRDEEWRSAYNALEAVRAQLLEELATADSTRAELMDQLAAVKVNQTAENSIEQHTANEEVFDLQKEVARLSYELSIEQEAHKRDVLDMKSAISEMHFKMSELLDLRISLEQELQEATLNRSIATPVTDEGALVKDIDTSESTSLHLEEMTSLRRQLDEEVRLRHDLENEVIYLQSIIEDQKAEEASDAVELRSKLALMEKELLQLRNDSTESDLAIQFEEIEKMKHFLTEEVRSLQEKLTLSQESTETVTTNLEKELSESETKYADILTVNDSYRSEIEVLTTQISAIEQERVQLKDEVTQLREELSASQVIASVDATDDADKFSALTASLEQANGEITDLAATITAREVELASTRKQLQTLENNSSEQHHQINESKLRLAEETATFEQSIGDLQKELADSVAGRHKLENDIIYLESELNDLRAAASSSAAALHARSDLETRLAQLESDKEALNQQILQLSGESHQSSREELLLREKLADHAEAYAALELAQTQISKELSTVRLEHAELQQKFAKNMDDSQRLQKQLLSAEAASAQLHKELINAQDYSGTLSAELENYKTLQENHSTSVSALRTQASELQRLNAEVDSLTKDLHTAKAEVTRLQDYCTRQEGEAAGLRLALRNSEEDLQSILEENNQLSNQTSSETRKLQELRDEVARLNNELQLAKSAHTELVSNKSPQQVRYSFDNAMCYCLLFTCMF